VTEASYNSIKEKWYPEVDHYVKDVPTILVGTKVDLREAKAPDPGTGEYKPVSTEMGQKLAKEIGAEHYIEVSAKTNANLSELFQQAVSTVIKLKKQVSEDDGKEEEGPNIVVVNRTVKNKKNRSGCVIL